MLFSAAEDQSPEDIVEGSPFSPVTRKNLPLKSIMDEPRYHYYPLEQDECLKTPKIPASMIGINTYSLDDYTKENIIVA
jgi:hypothetical protein